MTLAITERHDLAELLKKLGPDAPTLCDGWRTRDLATHLYLREHRLDAAAGMFVGIFANHLNKVAEDVEEKLSYEAIVDAWAAGPPKLAPCRLFDRFMNTGEHFIHHEDVRRAQPDWQPRELSAAQEKELDGVLKWIGVHLLRNSRSPVVMEPVGFGRHLAACRTGVSTRGDDVVRVRGRVGELVLMCFGRTAVDVTIDGDANRLVQKRV